MVDIFCEILDSILLGNICRNDASAFHAGEHTFWMAAGFSFRIFAGLEKAQDSVDKTDTPSASSFST